MNRNFLPGTRLRVLAQRVAALLGLPQTAPLALPVLFNLWILRAESKTVELGNDGSVHAAMIRWAAKKWASGRVPLDGWFPYLTTGSPLFHQYQSLGHILGGLFAVVFGGNRVYSWSVYLLVALWPVSVYIGARLLGWENRTALAAAFVASLLSSVTSYGFELSSYIFDSVGVWSQLFGMWLLPLALGLTWRAVHDGFGPVKAAVVLSATIVGHILVGYFALLAMGVWWLVGIGHASYASRTARAVMIGITAIVTGSWLLVPSLIDSKWSAGGALLKGSQTRDSFGLRRVLSWLLRGQLFDHPFTGSRFPVVTVLVFAGVIVCAFRFRQDVRARALLGLGTLSLVMFSGRPTFGFLLDRLPESNVLLFHRYILAVHTTGILLAAVGAEWLASLVTRWLRALRPRLRPAAIGFTLVLTAIAFLMPGWLERTRYADVSAAKLRTQERTQLADRGARAGLIQLAKRLGGGRVYAGLNTTAGQHYVVGFVQSYISLLNHDAEGIGFTSRVGSMLADVEYFLDSRSPQQLDLFGVRYLLTPRDYTPPVRARLIETRGNHALWEVPSTGYVSLVDTIEPIKISDRTRVAEVYSRFLKSADLRRGLYPTVAYLGQPAAQPTATRLNPPTGSAGSVTAVDYEPGRGVFHARVSASRNAAVMLKASYHGRWRVRLDGHDASKYMVAPGYPAITVSSGVHDVEFRYMPVPFYPWLFASAALALLALHLGMNRRARQAWLRRVGLRAGARGPAVDNLTTRHEVVGPLCTKEGELSDERGHGPVVVPEARSLNPDQEEENKEADVEREIDAPTDTQVRSEPGRRIRKHDGDDDAREQG